jgi:rhodanese-related sulfurtransferase
MTSWREEKRPTGRIERIDVPALHDRLERDSSVQVLDVRDRGEWDSGHIPGSVHCPYNDVRGVPDGIDGERPVAVICSSGQRSAVAGSLLRRAGVVDVVHVADGGVGTWADRGWPIERDEAGA